MKSKTYKGTSFKVIAPNTSCGLSIGYVESATGAVARVLAVEKEAQEKGYSASRWFVIRTDWSRTYNSKGEFLRESEHTEVAAIVNEDGTVEYKE